MALFRRIAIEIAIWFLGILISLVAFGIVMELFGENAATMVFLAFIVILPVLVVLRFVKPQIFTLRNKISRSDNLKAKKNDELNISNKNISDTSSNYDSEYENVQRSDTLSDLELLLKNLQREEKFVLMVGLLALYGDGELSQKEILQFREVISELKFAPQYLIHRDPTDEDLCLDEKLAWVISFIKTNFADVVELSNDEISEFFEALTISIEGDMDEEIEDKSRRRAYSDQLKKALTKIAAADGKISKRERKLIEKYVEGARYQYRLRGKMLGFGAMIVIAFFVYKALS